MDYELEGEMYSPNPARQDTVGSENIRGEIILGERDVHA